MRISTEFVDVVYTCFLRTSPAHNVIVDPIASSFMIAYTKHTLPWPCLLLGPSDTVPASINIIFVLQDVNAYNMMTSSNGRIFRDTGPLWEVTGEFPSQRPVTRSLNIFFDLHPNKPMDKQSWGWWFETPSRSSWRHYNERVLFWGIGWNLPDHDAIVNELVTRLV